MRPPHKSAGHRPHGAPMRPSHRPAGHRPHDSSMNPMRPNMNGARPNRSFFIQAHSYKARPFLKTSAVKTQYRAPWVPTVNRNNPPVNRKFFTGRRNFPTANRKFPTANRKFPTASKKFPTGSTKIHTADMGRKGKAVCYGREFEALMYEKFQVSAMAELNFFFGLQVLQREDGIFLSQDKYVGDILKKFGYSDVRSSNTPMDKENPWGKDEIGKDVDLHFYRSMIGSLVYLTASRPDIMFAICACARHQVTPKECHLHAVKRIFRYLKGHPKLGLWYPKESPFDLVAYSDSDYGGATQDRKSTTGGSQFWVEGTSKYWGVLRMLMISFRLIPLGEYNTDFHPMMDFIAASPLRGARIAQSSALPTVADEHASLVRDVSEGEACPTDSGFIADQDRATIAKSSSLPYDSAPRVTSPVAAEGSMQPNITKLTALCTSQQRQYSELMAKFQAQERRSIDEGEAATKRISDDSEELVRVLTSMDAATVFVGVIDVPTGSGFIPTAGPSVGDIPTGSNDVVTASPVFTTATVVTPYSRRKGKEVMVESDIAKKQRFQEHIDAQVARELEEQQEREDKRMTEQIARDAEVARIYAEEELQRMIDSLDRTNETIAKYILEYQEFASELHLERRIELISDLVKYQDNYVKTYKFQSQQRKPWTKKQKKDFYMAVIRSNLGWKVKDFKGMTFEEIEEKFNMIWKQVEDFIPMGSKEEAERYKKRNFMHAPVEWKLYDLCGVHQVTAKDKDIFMLVEKDYPLRKGLAIVMISYKLQMETYSRMAYELVLKIYKIASTPRQQGD
nr:hypothetical protein [Tanacetum cinerariifolium]